jgi:SAM-dependent methyltransferase
LFRRRRWAQSLWDAVGIPFRFVFFPDEWNHRLHWSSLEEERLRAVLPEVRGRLLDVGAGTNRLCRLYDGDAVGVDVHDFGGGATIIPDTRRLPFPDESFDTVTFVACLNHIPYRDEALREALRVLRPGGRIVATMIGRWLGGVGHKIWWYSEDKERGMAPGETGGLNVAEMRSLLEQAGFVSIERRAFAYRLNGLYCAEKPSV